MIFLLVVAAIGGPLALIPLTFFIIALGVGLWQAGQMRQLAERNQQATNRKTGLLVESVEPAEIIKSGQAGHFGR